MPAPATVAFQRAQLGLQALTTRELLQIWPLLDAGKLDETFPRWLLAATRVVEHNRLLAAALAYRYLREARAAAGLTRTAVEVPTPRLPTQRLATSLYVTSVVQVRRARANGVAAKTAVNSGFVTSSGAASRHVVNTGRDVVRSSVAADPEAQGWRRVTSGTGCSFCRMLASRGGVYKTESVGFDSHDHCNCAAEAVYR